MSIKKYIKHIPSFIRYNHYLHKLIFHKNNFSQLVKNLDKANVDFSSKYISLTVGDSFQLPLRKNHQLRWESNNENVVVDENGKIKALRNALGKESNAIIKATVDGKVFDEYFITIVDWIANKSYFEICALLPKYKILAKEDEKIYFSISKALYVTTDGFITKKYISRLPVLPAQSPPMLVTPKGYFIVGERKIFWTEDLVNWSLAQKVNLHGVKHSFDYYYDDMNDICYIYYAEYSCKFNNRHKVYRGIIEKDEKQIWDVILDFYSLAEYERDNNLQLHTARHIHIVTVDKLTGNLWVGVGDEDVHSKILYSLDNGNSFHILGIGSQDWRTLSIWFSEKYVYWNMDSHEPQRIFRTSKKLLLKRDDRSYKDHNKVSEIVNISKEVVAELHNGAMFTSCDIKQGVGDITIMTTSPEGNLRDMQGRVFGIKEYNNGEVSVQELISVSPKDKDAEYKTNMFTQLIPEFQDAAGYLYFTTRNLVYDGIIKAKLIWNEV